MATRIAAATTVHHSPGASALEWRQCTAQLPPSQVAPWPSPGGEYLLTGAKRTTFLFMSEKLFISSINAKTLKWLWNVTVYFSKIYEIKYFYKQHWAKGTFRWEMRIKFISNKILNTIVMFISLHSISYPLLSYLLDERLAFWLTLMVTGRKGKPWFGRHVQGNRPSLS